MKSIRDIISSLNETIELPKGSEVNGVAELVTKDDSTMPEINGRYAGIDDTFPIRIYHRILSMSSKVDTKGGYGNASGDVVNTYSLAMVVFLQHERAGKYPDELILQIQANMPDIIKMPLYKNIRVTFTGAALDSQSNWTQEYKTGSNYRLKSDQFLFKINYSIETTFSKGCFKECP